MSLKFYVNADGAYMGAVEGVPPEGWFEVPTAPPAATYVWDTDAEEWRMVWIPNWSQLFAAFAQTSVGQRIMGAAVPNARIVFLTGAFVGRDLATINALLPLVAQDYSATSQEKAEINTMFANLKIPVEPLG